MNGPFHRLNPIIQRIILQEKEAVYTFIILRKYKNHDKKNC